jgi:hypothetical protein
MKQKTLLILGGVLVASAVTWYLVKQDRAETFSGKASEVGQILLSDIPYETAAAFSVADEKHTVEIAKKDGKWVIPNRDDFPANVTTVNDLTDNAFNLKVQRVEKGVGASQYARLGLAAKGGEAKGEEVGKTISIKDASGKELGGLVVGKVQEVKSGADFDFSQPQPRPQWIKVNNADAIYLTATGFSRLEAEPKNWLDKEKFFKVEKLKSITVAGPTPEESWKIFREKDGDTELKLDAPAAGEEFDSAKASSQGSAFSFPSFDDILPEAEKAKAALDKPTHTVTIETFEGLAYTIKVGAKVEPPKQDPPKEGEPPPTPPEAYYISFNVSGALNETPPPYATPAPVAPTEPAALAADANEEAKKKYEEDKKKYEEAKKSHETAVKTWEEGKKNAEEAFKKELQTKKEKLAAEQALQSRTFIVQKYVLDVILKKRSEFMKDKPAAPAEGTSATPGTASPPVSVTPVTPAPGGKIEATTPPIEVKIPEKEGEGEEKSEKPADEKKAAPAKAEEKKTPKSRNR